MTLPDDLSSYVRGVFKAQWELRKGQTVPDPSGLKLSNDAVEFDSTTVLYADLSGSTAMVNSKPWWFAAEIYKSFLYCAARLIRDNGGEVVAYDGDRVMGIFIGDLQAQNAAICGLKINYATKHIITPLKNERYPDDGFVLRHVVGIDMSNIRAARTGVRGDNDLVWVGRAANYAAKLTEINEENTTWITAAVFAALPQNAKFGGSPSQLMWTKRSWTPMNNMEIHCSNWSWKI